MCATYDNLKHHWVTTDMVCHPCKIVPSPWQRARKDAFLNRNDLNSSDGMTTKHGQIDGLLW